VQTVASTGLAAWLVEAYLRGVNGRRSAVQSIAESPALFPLELPALGGQTLLSATRLDVLRLNETETYVSLNAHTGIVPPAVRR